MKKILICLALMANGGSIVFAQSNFVPAIILTKDNDSVQTTINYQNWKSNPGLVSTKSDLKTGATDIKGFVITQDNNRIIYLSKHFHADVTLYETTTFKEQVPVIEQLDTTVFLQQLVPGEYPLYKYTDVHGRDHYLYEAPGKDVNELVYVKTIIPGTDGASVYEKKLYREQLDTLFHDNPKLVRQNRSLLYYENNLVRAFVAYNNFKNPAEKIVVQKTKQNQVWFGVVGGVGFNSYKFKGDHYLKTDYKSSVNPTGGIFMDIPMGGPIRKFSLYNELLYNTLNTSGVLADRYSVFRGEQVSWDVSYIQLNVMFQYTYTKGLIEPFVHAGMGNAFMISEKKNELYSPQTGKTKTAIDGLRKHQQSAILGIGAQWSRFQLEGRLSTATGWVPYSNSSMPVNSFQVIGGIRF